MNLRRKSNSRRFRVQTKRASKRRRKKSLYRISSKKETLWVTIGTPLKFLILILLHTDRSLKSQRKVTKSLMSFSL